MGLVPDTKQGKINFFQSKIAPWTAAPPTAIGTTSAGVTALDGLVTAAADALAAQIAAESTFRTAVAAADEAVNAMAVAGANIISAIRTAGRTNSAVWTLAQIPAPATPTPVGAPGKPSALEAELLPNGALKLTFSCSNPAGCTNVIYQVYRKVTGVDAEFTYIGGAGQREFTDNTVPSGVASLTYSIQATRSTAVGIAQEFVVNFGTTGMTVTPTITTMGPKIAA